MEIFNREVLFSLGSEGGFFEEVIIFELRS